jgi:hypothetical protein
MFLTESEYEQLQQDFFITVITLAPSAATLNVSRDSWPGLLSLLGHRMRVIECEWVITLNTDNRAFLIQQAQRDNIQTKMVHFFLLHEGNELLTSFDCMCSLKLSKAFPGYESVVKTYALLLMK